MTSPQARKGDSFERQLVGWLRDQLGGHITRPRAGARHDRGDIAGIPHFTFEAKAYTDVKRAIREGLPELARERAAAGTPYGALIVKRFGVSDPAAQLVVMRLDDLVPLIRETWPTEAPAAVTP